MRLVATFILISLFTFCGCGHLNVYKTGTQHKVEMYSAGVKIKEWHTQGQVTGSPKFGYRFIDTSGNFTTISGDIIITDLQ
jgi:hypothetical protein